MERWYENGHAPKEDDSIALPKFDSNLAWEIGSAARNLAIERKPTYPVVVEITLTSGQVLFHATGNGAALDDDDWVRRERNTVFKFGKSTFFLGEMVRRTRRSISEILNVSTSDYAVDAGSVPIRLEGSDVVIAALTVNGLYGNSNHWVAIETLKKFAKES
ncbi:hypothetical protein JA9_003955 [Meyerozyma sp. JA9]|nr:hypothetical protein JA9_003955 [Meyerozyma sp. JA9]